MDVEEETEEPRLPRKWFDFDFGFGGSRKLYCERQRFACKAGPGHSIWRGGPGSGSTSGSEVGRQVRVQVRLVWAGGKEVRLRVRLWRRRPLWRFDAGFGSPKIVHQRTVEQRPRSAAARGVSDTVSHWRTRTAKTTCRQGQVTRGGSSSIGKSAGTTACCQRGLVFYGQVTGEKGQRRIKKMYVEATASKQKPDCLGMRKDNTLNIQRGTLGSPL